MWINFTHIFFDMDDKLLESYTVVVNFLGAVTSPKRGKKLNFYIGTGIDVWLDQFQYIGAWLFTYSTFFTRCRLSFSTDKYMPSKDH